jgi:hypothetical protein
MITPLPTVSLSLMWAYLQKQMDHHTTYGFGAKAALGANPYSYGAIDCSGESRELLFVGSGGKLVIPDGSATQHEYFEGLSRQGRVHKIAYGNIGQYGKGRLFIGFIAPNPIGHVWLIDGTKGETLESHGGGAGPDNRAWDDPILIHAVCACYEIPCIR